MPIHLFLEHVSTLPLNLLAPPDRRTSPSVHVTFETATMQIISIIKCVLQDTHVASCEVQSKQFVAVICYGRQLLKTLLLFCLLCCLNRARIHMCIFLCWRSQCNALPCFEHVSLILVLCLAPYKRHTHTLTKVMLYEMR